MKTSNITIALLLTVLLSFSYGSSSAMWHESSAVFSMRDLPAFPMQDTNQIIAFTQKAEYFLKNSSLDTAFKLATQALEWSEAASFYDGQINSMLILANVHKKKEAYAEALNYYLLVERQFDLNEDASGQYGLSMEIGDLYENWDVKEKAIDYYIKAYSLVKGSGNDEENVRSLRKISECYLTLKDYPSAVRFSLELLQLQKNIGSPGAVLNVLKNISNTYILSNNHIEALKYELEILSLKETLNNEVEIGNSLNNIGFLYKHLGDNELALHYFRQSLDFNRALNTKGLPNVAEKKILMNIGIIYHSLGEYKKSLRYEFEALQRWVSRGSPLEIADIYNKIALNYLMLRDYEKAMDYAETALQLAESDGNKKFLAECYKSISELCHYAGNDREALRYYQQYAKVNDALLNEQSEKQEELTHKQLEIEKKENDLRQLIAEKELGALELKKLQLETDKKEKDIKILLREKELREISIKNQQFEKERLEQNLILANSQLEMESRDNKIALLKTNDSIQSLALKQKTLEERERLKDIALLKQQKANQEMILEEQKTYRKIFGGALLFMMAIICLIIKSYWIKKNANKKLAHQNNEIQAQKEKIEQQKDGLEQAYTNIKLLSEIAKDINANLSIEKISSIVYANINTMMDATAFGIGIYNENTQNIEIQGAMENGERIPKMKISLKDDNRLATWCYTNKQVAFINDYQSEFQSYFQQKPPPLRNNEDSVSIIYVPLVVKEKCIGTLTVQSAQKNAYTEFHLNLLLNLAVYIAIAVENAKAYQLIEERTQALENTLTELQAAQVQLIQAEKMASLGLLTAGIAHEINNPINFVYAGVDSMSDAIEDLLQVLQKYESLDNCLEIASVRETLGQVQQLKQQLKFSKTTASIPKVVNAIKEGAERTAEIVKGLRNFSRLDESEQKVANIHDGIDSTLILLSSKIKQKNILVNKIYDRQLPLLNCYPGQLNQVFMNLLNNAIEAVEQEGIINIKTLNYESEVIIIIRDNGIGIPEVIKNRIFEPFFTTKEPGQGTGLGLSISYGIIEKHEGTISINNSGKGTEFLIRLPRKQHRASDTAKKSSSINH